MVGDHIIRAPAAPGQVRILPLGQKELRICNPGVALIAINEFSQIRFLRILHIVNDVRNGRGNIPAFSNMQWYQPCGRYTITSLSSELILLPYLLFFHFWFIAMCCLLSGIFIQAVTDRRPLLRQRTLPSGLGEK